MKKPLPGTSKAEEMSENSVSELLSKDEVPSSSQVKMRQNLSENSQSPNFSFFLLFSSVYSGILPSKKDCL